MMKSFFKKLAFVMALAMVVSLAAPAATTAAAAEELKIAYQNGSAITELNLANVNDVEDLKFLGAKTWENVVWESSDETVATVNSKGEVTAVAAGTANITVTVDGLTATVKVNVVDLPTYTAFMGVTKENPVTELDFVVGDEPVDLAFFGIKDYDAKRYVCDWLSADDEIATVDNKGVITPVAPGKTKITLSVKNFYTGVRHTVDYCVVTVTAAATPTPAQGIAIQNGLNKTESTVVVELSGLNAKDYAGNSNKYSWEVYALVEGTYEYAWEVFVANADEKTNTVTLTGYNEFAHDQKYVVKLVSAEDNNGNRNTLFEDDFVASVGPVDRIEVEYASYFNNQKKWAFGGHAYTNGNEGEEIQTLLTYKLYDEKGVDVTGHYNAIAAAGNYDIVSYEIIDETNEVAPYINIFEEEVDSNLAGEETIMVFSDFPEKPFVLRAVYEDYDNLLQTVVTKDDKELIIAEKAPAYKINGIDKWDLALTDNTDVYTNNLLKRQWLALFDDYDEATNTDLLNHHIILWFTDSYGNKFTTLAAKDGAYYSIKDSAKFTTEGYEIHFDTRHPQVLLVGGVEDDTIDDTITTKKIGNATVNVTLHNTVRDNVNTTLVSHVEALNIKVDKERQITTVNVGNLQLTTDSKPMGAEADIQTLAGSGEDYDKNFTKGTAVISVLDQYSEAWGKVNASRLNDITVTVTTDAAVSENNVDLTTSNYDAYSRTWKKAYDGAALLDELGNNTIVADDKVSYIKYNVTVEDSLADRELKKSFNVSLKQPTHDETGEIVYSTSLKLSETNNDNSVKYTDLETTIYVTEYSKNGLAVNRMDDITLITTPAQYDTIFADGNTAVKGALYAVLYDTKNQIVPASTENGTPVTGMDTSRTLGIYEIASGVYGFRVADTKDGAAATEFLPDGTYKFKLLQVTGATVNGKVAFKTPYSLTITVVDNRTTVTLDNQEAIYADATDIEEIAFNSFSFLNEKGESLSAFNFYDGIVYDGNDVDGELAGVKYRENTRANSVVVQNVYFKVFIAGNFEGHECDPNYNNAGYKTTGYYYISVPVQKTVKFDGAAIDTDCESIIKLDNATLDAYDAAQ